MASLAAAGRFSARLAGRQWMQSARGFRTTARFAVAQNFTMPALSPTMTEGNIAAWRVKEGDTFAPGDVLLEIETDKATMDVEAQDEGIVFKILQKDGTKGVPVGARIGVLAEAGDDLASLEIPPDVPVPAAAKPEAAPAPAPTPAPAATAAPPAPKPAAAAAATATTPPKAPRPQPRRNYPLLPSVEHLFHERGLDTAVAAQITPTGPGGRLIKGDVLAYLGQVAADVPAALEARFETWEHLDLSNVRVREAPAKKASPEEDKAKAAAAAAAAAAEAAAAAAAAPTSVSLPISLAAVRGVQDKIQASIGVFLPVGTFVARATELANDALPRAGPPPPPSAAALFDAIVSPGRGLSSPSAAAARVTHGHYLPRISGLSSSSSPSSPKKPAGGLDVIDILAGNSRAATTPVRPAVRSPPLAVSTGVNIFSLDVPAAEAKRAQVFLERLKTVLENEPGRLVL